MKIRILGFCLLLMGCTGYQYIAPPHYVPVNLEKGKLNANFSYNFYQLGYSISDNFSIFTTGYYRNNIGGILNGSTFKENSGAYKQKDKQKEFDFGLTFYRSLNNYFSYEIVSGVGMGSVEYSNTQDLYPDYEFSFDAKKLSVYMQPNFSIFFNKYLDVSIFSRINHCRYYNINNSLSLGPKPEPDKYDQYFIDRKIASLFFVEPGLQFRIGLEDLKFKFLITNAFDLKNTGIQYRHFNLYMGISLNFDILKKQ